MKTQASQGSFWLTSLSLPSNLHSQWAYLSSVGLSFIKIPPFPFNKRTCTGLGISRADLDREDHLFLLAPSVAYGSGNGFQWATLELPGWKWRDWGECLLYWDVFFWVDPGQPIWPVTRSLDRVDHRVGFKNYVLSFPSFFTIYFFFLLLV